MPDIPNRKWFQLSPRLLLLLVVGIVLGSLCVLFVVIRAWRQKSNHAESLLVHYYRRTAPGMPAEWIQLPFDGVDPRTASEARILIGRLGDDDRETRDAAETRPTLYAQRPRSTFSLHTRIPNFSCIPFPLRFY